jgi:decaprenylphospho-beta-D-erythro-pentofuranosid-2-ulose 2-reductase
VKDALGSVQTLLVLGGGSEIGLATARSLARERTRSVILAARAPDRLADAADELRNAGAADVELVDFDATDYASHGAFVDRVFERDGDIDAVLLAFGVLGDQSRLERDPAAARVLLETNLVGAVSVTLPIVERLRRQGHGTVVVLSSVAAERPRRANFIYGASKAGLDAFAQGLGDSLAGTGVDVVVIRPGFVRTKMTAGLEPAPFATTPDAVADAIATALRTSAHTVWVPSPLRAVMSVMRHLPRPVFRRLAARQ